MIVKFLSDVSSDLEGLSLLMDEPQILQVEFCFNASNHKLMSIINTTLCIKVVTY